MKIIFTLVVAVLLFAVPAFGQEKPEPKSATDADKVAAFDKDGMIKRGAPIAEVVDLEDVFANPKDYVGKTVRVEGYIVRSCQKQGCWAELGAKKDAKETVRVTMKDHQFFIPLKSAGFKAVTEGVFGIKTLSKEQVKHLVEDDGAKFDKINEDGTVTVMSLVATGIVLKKA